MSRSRDIRRFATLLIITALALLASQFLIPGAKYDILRHSFAGQYLHIGWFYENPAVSGLSSVILLAAFPVMFLMVDRRHPMGSGPSMALLYAIFILTCKDALHLSPIHLAAFFLTWAIYFSFKASMDAYNVDNPFMSMLFIATASLFYVPLIWLAPAMAALDNNNSARKDKTIPGSLCGLLLPMVFITAIHAMSSGFRDIAEPALRYMEMTIDIDPGLPPMLIASIVKAAVMTIAAIWAAASMARALSTLDISAERIHVRCMLYCMLLAVIALVFGSTSESFPWLLVMMPYSLIMFVFFANNAHRRGSSFLLTILLLLILAERAVLLF